MSKKSPPSKTRIDAHRHADKRKNIPTEELRDFVADEEKAPKTLLYPRDPSLDPQLVWQGKDDQDRQDLAVPAVPIYIQEKIHPQAIINALPRIEQAGSFQPNLFADFNGLEGDFEKQVDFYSQKDDRQKHWSNRMILGDSLLVMTSLAEKEGLALINGTDGMLGMLVLAITDLRMLLRTADIAAAMSVEGQLGTELLP